MTDVTVVLVASDGEDQTPQAYTIAVTSAGAEVLARVLLRKGRTTRVCITAEQP